MWQPAKLRPWALTALLLLGCSLADQAQRAVSTPGPTPPTAEGSFDLGAGAAAFTPTETSSDLDVDRLWLALQADTNDQRPEVLALLGRPDAFSIEVVEVEGVLVTLDSWRYFRLASQVDFVDGAVAWTMALEPAPEDAFFPAWYYPIAFEANMDAAAALLVATDASPAGMIPIPMDWAEAEPELPDLQLLVGDQIMLGFLQQELVFVETVPLYPQQAAQ